MQWEIPGALCIVKEKEAAHPYLVHRGQAARYPGTTIDDNQIKRPVGVVGDRSDVTIERSRFHNLMDAAGAFRFTQQDTDSGRQVRASCSYQTLSCSTLVTVAPSSASHRVEPPPPYSKTTDPLTDQGYSASGPPRLLRHRRRPR